MGSAPWLAPPGIVVALAAAGPSIVIILIGVAAATWLFFDRGRAMWQAYLLLTLAGTGLCLLLLATPLLLTPREEWEEIPAMVAKTVRDDRRGRRHRDNPTGNCHSNFLQSMIIIH